MPPIGLLRASSPTDSVTTLSQMSPAQWPTRGRPRRCAAADRLGAGAGHHPRRVDAADHRQQAQELLLELHARGRQCHHVGITGVPGVGKSTTIEALGMHLIDAGHRVAVLAVDPSSTRTGGVDPRRQDPDGQACCAPGRVYPARPRPRARSAGWPGRRARRSCCSRRPVTTSSWSRPWGSGSPR